jgi:hypothetical protein
MNHFQSEPQRLKTHELIFLPFDPSYLVCREPLRARLDQMAGFDRAALAMVRIPADSKPILSLLLECQDRFDLTRADVIAEVMAPFMGSQDQDRFQVIPIPPGPWWENIIASSVILVDRRRGRLH